MRRIATARDLCNLAAYVNAGLTFKLVDDIDLNTVGNFTPVKYFSGHLRRRRSHNPQLANQFVGLNFNVIQHSSSSGAVISLNYVGDFVGINNGRVG